MKWLTRVSPRFRKLLAISVVTVLVLALFVKFAPLPYVWVGGLGALVGFGIAAKNRKKAIQVFSICTASIFLAIFAAELAAIGLLPTSAKTTKSGKYLRTDDHLGWSNVPGSNVRVASRIGSRQIFNVKYSINNSGYRIPPPDRGTAIEGCAIFFADSFVFGEGVENEETFPFRIGMRMGGFLRVINLGVGGYGAHHMLAQLQHHEFLSKISCTPTYVFYLALPHHVLRTAHKTSYQAFFPSSPRYALDESGSVHRLPPNIQSETHLVPQTSWRRLWTRISEGLLRRSMMYQVMSAREEIPSDSDLRLYYSVITHSKKMITELWPSAEFHILAWNLHEWYAQNFERFRSGLLLTGANVHDIDNMLPGYQNDRERYSLDAQNLHPNPLAHDLISAYVTRKVIVLNNDKI